MSGPETCSIDVKEPMDRDDAARKIRELLADRDQLVAKALHTDSVRRRQRSNPDPQLYRVNLSVSVSLEQLSELLLSLGDHVSEFFELHVDSSSVGLGAVTPGNRPIVGEAGDDTRGETPAAGVVSGEPLRRNVTANVRFLLAAKKLSQSELADRMGIAAGTLSQRFSGRSRWSLMDLQKLSEVFEVEPDWLIESRSSFIARIAGVS